MHTTIYPDSVMSQEDRNIYDDAFDEGESDCADGRVKNNYAKGSAGYLGYEAGVESFSPVREDWEAQADYSARWY